MVLHDEIEKRGCLLFDGGVKLLSSEGLIDLPYGTLEGVILFSAE